MTLNTPTTSFNQQDFDNSFNQWFYILDFGLYPDAITADYKYMIQFKSNPSDENPVYSINTVKVIEKTSDNLDEEIEGIQLWKMMLSHHLFNTWAEGGFIPRQFQRILKSPNEIGAFYKTMETVKQQETFKNEVKRIIAILD